MKRFPVIIITLLLIIALPMETFAASKPKQVKNLKASAKTATSITLKWNRTKGAKGYEIQQFDAKTNKWKSVKRLKPLKYKIEKLEANKSYRYRVRAYSSYKQYFNSKTKKWQNKKPAKKNWENNKTRTKYIYGKYSSVLTVKTKAKTARSNKKEAAGDSSTGTQSCKHDWCNWYVSEPSTRTQKGKESRWCHKCYGYEHREAPLKPANPFAMPITSWIGQKDDGYVIGDKITLTDYQGVTRTFVKTKFYWEDESSREHFELTDHKQLARYCKDVDGTFKNFIWGGYEEFIQRNGITFIIGETGPSNDDLPGVVMYNGDENKLQIVVKNKMETFNSYNYDKEPITRTYIMKDGYRLVPYYGTKTERSTNGRCITKKLDVFNVDVLLHQVSCGFVSGDVVADVLYDGKKMGQIKYSVNRDADASGLSKCRRGYLNVALAAIKANGGPKNYHTDMMAIKDYIYQNYSYRESFGLCNHTHSMTCAGGAGVLETYSIYQYKVYGFFGYGSSSPGNSATYGTHVAFHPDTKPAGFSSYNPPHTYFQTQGHY